MRDFHLPGRSPALASEAMAATSHPLATLAAVEMLRAGGTAADAAVSALAVLCVVEPAMTGIGGDCFCLVAKPDKPIWGYNGSGRAPGALRIEALIEQGVKKIGPESIHSVTVPGAVEGWEAILKAHGRFGFDRVLAPAIHYAENGFPVAPRVAYDWENATEKLAADAGGKRHYLKDGKAPRVGDIVRLPALASTLKAIAERGARALYEGPIAEEIAATVKARGGFLRAEDLAAHRGNEQTPISTNYRGLDLVELPPNGQGMTALIMLNILEQFDMQALDPVGPERFHLALEAARMAYAVRDTHLADPDAMRISVDKLLDKTFAHSLAAKLDPSRRVAIPPAPTPGSDTTYLTVVDRDRTAVSLINSLYHGFGTGIVTENSGVVLHSRGACFVMDPTHPNAIGPNKRPMHTIIPAMATRDGRCAVSFGVMGAAYQPMGHVQVMLNLVDYGMDVQAAIDMARTFFEGEESLVERAMPAATVEGLRARGHNVSVVPSPWGGGQAIQIDWDKGVLIGGSDHRKDGCALGY
jgi:gamma-glutamyltranspeptidase/glutathione hydrolase